MAKEVTPNNLKEVLALSVLTTEKAKDALVQDIKETNERLEQEATERDQADQELAGHIGVLQQSVETLDDKKADREEVEERIKTIELTPGPKGDSYIITDKDKKEIAKSIVVPVVEKVIERTEVVREQPIITNEIKEVAMFETGEQIVDKINDLPLEPEFQIDASHIKNLPESKTIYQGGGGGLSLMGAEQYFIRKDGLSTTTARIPFAEGALMTGSKELQFNDANHVIKYRNALSIDWLYLSSAGGQIFLDADAIVMREALEFSTAFGTAAGFSLEHTGGEGKLIFTGRVGGVTKGQLLWDLSEATSNVVVTNNSGGTTGLELVDLDLVLDTDQALYFRSAANHINSPVAGELEIASPILRLTAGTTYVGDINTSGRITSTIGTGTAPFAITSTTLNTNLNADMVDGLHASSFVQTSRTLTTTSPIRIAGGASADLSADRTLSWDFSVANTWTGAQKINVNSATALFVEQDGVKDNVFVVDTNLGTVAIGTTPASTASLTITDGTISRAINTSRTVSTRFATSQAINISETQSWSGASATNSGMALLFTDSRVINSGGGTDTINGLQFTMSRTLTYTNSNSTLSNLRSIVGSVTDAGNYTKGSGSLITNVRVSDVNVNLTPVFNNSGGSFTYNVYGTLVGGNIFPVNTASSSLAVNIYGTYVNFAGTTEGTSKMFVFYNNSTGTDADWCLWNDSTTSDNFMGGDNRKTYFGTGTNALGSSTGAVGDVFIQYTGSVWDFDIGIATTEIVFNNSSFDTDFRIEGNGDANNFFSDAGNDRIGIGTNAPGSKLDVAGSFQCDSITNDTGLAHGTYTPTLTGVANVAASTAYACQYMRVGNTVTVSGKVDIDPTLTTTTTQLGVSLPVASNFANSNECGGVGNSPAVTENFAVYADAANNRAQIDWIPVSTANNSFWFTFTYLVI